MVYFFHMGALLCLGDVDAADAMFIDVFRFFSISSIFGQKMDIFRWWGQKSILFDFFTFFFDFFDFLKNFDFF